MNSYCKCKLHSYRFLQHFKTFWLTVYNKPDMSVVNFKSRNYVSNFKIL